MNFMFGAPVNRAFARPSAVSPFTYRDGATFQEILRALEESISQIVSWTEEFTEAVVGIEGRVRDLETTRPTKEEVEERVQVVERALAQARIDLEALIHTATNVGSATDPTDGVVKDIDSALGQIYNFVRVFARFAREEDLTAAQFDALAHEARHADLAPLTAINDH